MTSPYDLVPAPSKRAADTLPPLVAVELSRQLAPVLAARLGSRGAAAGSAGLPDAEDAGASWTPVDLAEVVAAGYEAPSPDLLRTSDGVRALLYRGCINGFHGDSGIGKSWLAHAAVAQVIAAGERVMVIDYESNAGEVVARLDALGVQREGLLERLTYLHPDEPATDEVVASVIEQCHQGVALVVIDSLGEAFGVEGVDENSDAEVGPWLRRVPRRIAEAGPAVLLIDHATKAKENPLHPSGSKRKRAAITGASYLVAAKSVPTREAAGTLTVTCAKDRHGHWRRGEVAVTADITPYPDDGVTVNLHTSSPGMPTQDDRVRIVAKRLVEFVKAEGGGLSTNELIKRAPINGATDLKKAAADYAVRVGALSRRDGPRKSVLYDYVAPIEEAENDCP